MTSIRNFDLVVFDWDGTLFDSTMLIVRCIQSACRDIGVTVPSDFDAAYVIGLGLHDALQHAVPGLPPERYPELGARYRQHYIASQHELVLFPGTLAMLQALKTRDHLLAVATGDRQYQLSVAPDFALTDAQLRQIESVAIEPALRQNDWAGAAISAAEGISAALQGDPIAAGEIIPGDESPGGGAGAARTGDGEGDGLAHRHAPRRIHAHPHVLEA